jgi:hypothetical protein
MRGWHDREWWPGRVGGRRGPRRLPLRSGRPAGFGPSIWFRCVRSRYHFLYRTSQIVSRLSVKFCALLYHNIYATRSVWSLLYERTCKPVLVTVASSVHLHTRDACIWNFSRDNPMLIGWECPCTTSARRDRSQDRTYEYECNTCETETNWWAHNKPADNRVCLAATMHALGTLPRYCLTGGVTMHAKSQRLEWSEETASHIRFDSKLIVRSPNTSLFLAHKRKKKIITPTICNILPYYLKQQGSPFVLAVKETESKYNHISAHFTIRGKRHFWSV